MIHYLDPSASSPLLTLGAVLYYALAAFGGVYVLWRVCRRLIASGSDRASVARFALVVLAVGAPAACLGYRAASLLPLPLHEWSWDLLCDAPRIDGPHSFHGTLLLPFAVLSALAWLWRYRQLEVLDTAFLFLPIAHVASSVGCLLMGCCWGETARLGMAGFHATFPNPTPLYSIGLNLLIFALLRKMFRVAYQSRETRVRYEGIVCGSYLLLYGAARLVMEAFRHQELVLARLGRAELAMLVLVASGAGILWRMHARAKMARADLALDEGARLSMTRLTSILGIASSYLILIFVFHYLTRRTHILPTPFARAHSVGDAYTRLVFCLPLLVPALAALFFFRRAGERVRPYLRWPPASAWLALALGVSGLYALAMLVPRGSSLASAAYWAYWPPILILSTVNSVSEEVTHRLGVLRLLVVSGAPEWASLGIQAALYSLVHFTISPSFGVMSLLYGLLLGTVMNRTRSLSACIVCHFVIDLGGIGGPLLAG